MEGFLKLSHIYMHGDSLGSSSEVFEIFKDCHFSVCLTSTGYEQWAHENRNGSYQIGELITIYLIYQCFPLYMVTIQGSYKETFKICMMPNFILAVLIEVS